MNKLDTRADRHFAAGLPVVLEHDVYSLLESVGFPVPRHMIVQAGESPEQALLASLGEKLVLKILSPEVLHKSDLGGVIMAENNSELPAIIEKMIADVTSHYCDTHAGRRPHIEGVLIVERVTYTGELGSELLLGARYSREFGPLITFGIGGTDAEFLSGQLNTGRGHAIMAARLLDKTSLEQALSRLMVFERLSGKARGRKALIDPDKLVEAILRFRDLVIELSRERHGHKLEEIEINPLVISAAGELVPLDGLMRISRVSEQRPARPLEKIEGLLNPKTVAIAGVSRKMNVGRIILQNLLDARVPKEQIFILKPDEDEIEGVRCFPSPGDLPEKVDMLVLAVSAAQVPEMLEAICTSDCAKSIIVIPGGIAEKEGGEAIQARIDQVISMARQLPGGGPVINGSNCLGVYCRDANVNTLFIPEYKLPRPVSQNVSRTAFFSQSGAFMICRMSRNPGFNPVYAVSYGNQMDLTLGDYLSAMITDENVSHIACYAEGFADLDGLNVASQIGKLKAAGKSVLFYKAGRTAEGQSASAGHTASIAGDYESCRQILSDAGALLVDSFEAFERQLELVESLPASHYESWPRVAVLSNAGFECVGVADNLHHGDTGLALATLSSDGRKRIASLLAEYKLDSLVDVKNPLDLTPMADDRVWKAATLAMLEDADVDAAIVSIVPLTAAMQTLKPGSGHREDFRDPGAMLASLTELKKSCDKPFVVSIDSGPLYESMANALKAAGIAVFRYSDEAMRHLATHLAPGA